MKRWHISLLILAALLLFAGLDSVIWPQSAVFIHPANGMGGASRNYWEVISPTGARIYGILAMLLGLGIAFLAIYHGKDEPPPE